MSAIGIVLLVAGILLAVVSGIWLIVSAFQESLLWGLCVLLVPGVPLVFVIVKWSRARAPFLISLAAVGLMFGGVLALPSGAVQKVDETANKEAQEELMQARIDMMNQEDSVKAEEIRLQTAFTQLKTKMAALNSKNAAEVAAYNQEVVAYEAQRKQFAANKNKLAAAKKEFDGLLDSAPRPQAANVVVYTTKTCGTCATAKAFLRSKNVPYREVDVQASQAAFEEYKKFGSGGVPVIVVGGEVMQGFNQQRLEQLLAAGH